MTDITTDLVRGDLLSWAQIEMLMRAMKGYAVLDGYALSAQGTPDDTIAGAAGNSIFAAKPIARAAAGNITIAACSETQYRIDAFYAKDDGTIGIHQGDNAAKSDPLGNDNWRQYIAPVIKAAIPAGSILGCCIVKPRAGGVPVIEAGDIWSWGPVNKIKEIVTAPIEVDHEAASPFTFFTAPANSIISLASCRNIENESGCVLTIGDEDDPDSHCTDALMPVATTDAPVVAPLPAQYYATAKALRATVTTAGTSGKWNVQFRVTLGGA
jgi:hypothetical protein